jgi:hypothetical protein
MQGDDVVRLATASNSEEAHLWQQALADEGVEARVVGGSLEATFGDMSGTSPEVWVHRRDYEKARAFLDAHHGAADADTETETEEA